MRLGRYLCNRGAAKLAVPHPNSNTECAESKAALRDQFADGVIFVKALRILPRAKAVIETLRLFRRKVATPWLWNAPMRIPAASAFSGSIIAQAPGLAN